MCTLLLKKRYMWHTRNQTICSKHEDIIELCKHPENKTFSSIDEDFYAISSLAEDCIKDWQSMENALNEKNERIKELEQELEEQEKYIKKMEDTIDDLENEIWN